MKITIYTITDCPFCKQEKEFLTSKGLQFEEKNVQQNRDFLTEMLDISNKFAGVPFTMIEKDNGEKVGLKGFTQSEFEQALGLSATPPAANMPAKAAPSAQPPTTPTSSVSTSAPSMTMGSVPSDGSSSMPEPTKNMPTMPGIDEAPPSNAISDSGHGDKSAQPPVNPVPPQGAAKPAQAPTPSTAVTSPSPVAAAASSASSSTPPASSNTQNQLDGLLADLQTKAQPDLPDFSTQSPQGSSQQ